MKFSSQTLLFFDCDGVLLKSNEIKSNAFYEVALHYTSPEIALEFKSYHQQNGGISRNKKFEYFFKTLLKKDNSAALELQALAQYEKLIFEKLQNCELVDGVLEFIQKCPQKKYVVSGGKQQELQEIFKMRGLDKYFEAICGSPQNKYDLIQKLPIENNPARVFFGDSKVDYEVAAHFKMDFYFVHGCSELKNWQEFLKNKTSNEKPVNIIADFTELLID